MPMCWFERGLNTKETNCLMVVLVIMMNLSQTQRSENDTWSREECNEGKRPIFLSKVEIYTF